MPDSIDLGSYSVFVPPDPFEDHVGPFYFRIRGDARQAGSVHCVLPTHERHGNYAGGVHGGAILAFADYALCLVAGRAADGVVAVALLGRQYAMHAPRLAGVARDAVVERPDVILEGIGRNEDRVAAEVAGIGHPGGSCEGSLRRSNR